MVRRALLVGLGVLLVILGLLGYHVEAGTVLLGLVLIGGVSIDSVLDAIRGKTD